MVGEQIAPTRGVGGGCQAPWDFDEIVKRALASQSGVPELAWHWCNWDWREWLSGHIQREFKDFSHMRYWVYESRPEMTANGGVRVTYKADLLPHNSGSREPEFKPVEVASDGVTLQTKASGQDIMLSYPDLAEAAPPEPWKPSNPADAEGAGQSCWFKDTVFKHIINDASATAKQFPPEQQAQWRALRDFHDMF
eukprot:1237431-Pleurochrysis_carterae.AAC.2